MASQEYYYNLIKKQQEAQKNKDIADIKAQTDAQKKMVEENYNIEVGNTAAGYDILHRKNALQKELNQRHIERKAAEMGLTDSGFNRTQQTAAQLSYANQSAEYSRQEQKAVDTLAAAMRTKITELETNQNTSINSIERTYDQSATEQAGKLYEADVEAETKAEEARIAAEIEAAKIEAARVKAEIEAAAKAEAERISSENALNREMYNSQNSLISILNNKDISESEKQAYVKNFISRYGAQNTYDTLNNLGMCNMYYSTFSGSDWVDYFSGIKDTYGSTWAIESINDYASRGILPAQYAKQAAAAVRGGRVGG